MTTLPTLGILFPTAASAVTVAKLVILGIPYLTFFILALRAVVVVVAKLVTLSVSLLTSTVLELRVVLLAKLVISGILYFTISFFFKQ